MGTNEEDGDDNRMTLRSCVDGEHGAAGSVRLGFQGSPFIRWLLKDCDRLGAQPQRAIYGGERSQADYLPILQGFNLDSGEGKFYRKEDIEEGEIISRATARFK